VLLFFLRVEAPKQPQLIMILGCDCYTLHYLPYFNISEKCNLYTLIANTIDIAMQRHGTQAHTLTR